MALTAVVLATSVRADKPKLDRLTPVGATEQIPALDFFRQPILSSPQINPGGTRIAALGEDGSDGTGLFVYPLGGGKPTAIGASRDSVVTWAYWLDDEHTIYSLTSRVQGSGNTGLFGADVNGAGTAYPLLQYVGARLIAVPPGDRMHPLAAILANSVNSGKYDEAVSLEAANMTGKMLYYTRGEMPTEDQEEIVQGNNRHISKRYPILQPSSGFTLNYFADKDGKLEFGMTMEDGVMRLHHLNGDRWEVCPIDLDEMEFFGAGDKPGEAIMLTARKDDKPRSLVRVDAATGKVGDALIQDAGYDFNGYFFRDPSSHVIVGAVFDQGGPKMAWFNESYRGLQKAVDSLFPGKVVRILGLSDSGKIALISTASDKQPAIYSWVDLEKRGAGLIKNSRPWIDPARMQAVNVMKYKTRDGRRVDALVTLPAGASKDHPVPLVVIPPDWQAEHVAWGFDERAQYFASRGYAVLRPNHRGSRGYRWMFSTSDEWDYQKMYQDVADATKTVLRTGVVDPHRVAILGSNFGGFLALSAAAYEPELYRAAIALSPTCDWAHSLQEQKFFANSNPFYGQLIRKLGDPKKDAARFDALSPLRHADAIRAAVFIGNGEWDASFDIGDAKDLVNTVRKRGVNAEQVTFSGESGGLAHLEQKLDFYSRMESFLAQNLGGGK